MIDLRKEVETLFGSLLEGEIRTALTTDAVEKSIVAVIGNWARKRRASWNCFCPRKTWPNWKRGLRKSWPTR